MISFVLLLLFLLNLVFIQAWNPSCSRSRTGRIPCTSHGRNQFSIKMAIAPTHRNYGSMHWFDCIKGWPKSRILARIKPNILWIAAWTALLNFLLQYFNIKLSFPFFIHTIAGSALSLLLVFKTNTSYDRFWEGRKLWGAILGACRGFTRLAYVYADKKHHRALGKLLVVFCTLLRLHLRAEVTPSALSPFLQEPDITSIMRHKHKPLIILRRLEQLVHTLITHEDGSINTSLPDNLCSEYRSYINVLSNSMGACERIVKTPAPYFYSINTSRFLSLYLFTLPLAMIPYLHWYTVPTIMAVSWCFVSIQEIGHFIEDPFNSEIELIPMGELASVIQSNMADTLEVSLAVAEDKDEALLFPLPVYSVQNTKSAVLA